MLKLGLCKESKNVLDKIKEKSKISSNNARHAVLSKFKQLGFSETDLDRVLEFIKNKVPLVVNFKLKKHLPFFHSDTHYRNSFEINTGKGKGYDHYRLSKEHQLFGEDYGPKLEISKRLKYGSLLLTGKPGDATSAQGYGESYFLLRDDEVRWRVTVTRGNSETNSKVGTLEHFIHILQQYTDNELRCLCRASNSNRVASSEFQSYTEIQIHGLVRFEEDVHKIFVNKKFKTDKKIKKQVAAFNLKNRIVSHFF